MVVLSHPEIWNFMGFLCGRVITPQKLESSHDSTKAHGLFIFENCTRGSYNAEKPMDQDSYVMKKMTKNGISQMIVRNSVQGWLFIIHDITDF